MEETGFVIVLIIGIAVLIFIIYLSELNKNDDKPKPPPNLSVTLSHQDTVKKYEKLKAVKSLLDDGILTQEEFDKEKQIILDN